MPVVALALAQATMVIMPNEILACLQAVAPVLKKAVTHSNTTVHTPKERQPKTPWDRLTQKWPLNAIQVPPTDTGQQSKSKTFTWKLANL